MHVHAPPSRAVLRYTLILIASVLGACASANTRAPIDTFDDPSDWNLVLADGVRATTHNDTGALRVDYDFTSGSGYCIIRKQVDLDLDLILIREFVEEGRDDAAALHFIHGGMRLEIGQHAADTGLGHDRGVEIIDAVQLGVGFMP